MLAADLHQSHAIFNLGLMYEAGDGVAQGIIIVII
jgi:TPR repeat protein